MIPRTVILKNFLCYGNTEQVIDFKDYSLICLSGKNGAGKSALLDAMTWAIWGQARKISGAVKADEGLVRLGATRMMVSFEFEFNQKIYRVRREFAKTYGKPYAALDFELFNAAEDKFISLTDKTIRHTQEKIEQTIGFDFETFINSAFLKQNQSNEFSKKSPKERKQILATILGLNRYELLQQQILDKAKQFLQENKITIALQEQQQRELNNRQEVVEQHQHIIQQLAEIQKELIVLQQEYKTHEENKKIFEEGKNRCAQVKKNLEEVRGAISELTLSLRNQRSAWRKTHTLSLTLPPINVLQAQQEKLSRQEKNLLEQKQAMLILQEEILGYKEKLHLAARMIAQSDEEQCTEVRVQQEKKQMELAYFQEQVKQKQDERRLLIAQQKKYIESIKEADQKLLHATSLEKALQIQRSQFEKRKSFFQAMRHQEQLLTGRLLELEHKNNMVQDLTNPSCPLCEQLLTANRKKFLAQRLIKEQGFIEQRLKRVKKLLIDLRLLLQAQHDHLAELNKSIAEYVELRHIRAGYQQEREKLEATEKEVSHLLKTLEDNQQVSLNELKILTQRYEQLKTFAEQQLQQHPQLQALQEQVRKREKDKQGLLWSQQEYEQVKQKMSAVQIQVDQVRTFEHERMSQQHKRYEISRLCSLLRENKNRLIQYECLYLDLNIYARDSQLLEEKMVEIQSKMKYITLQKDSLLQQFGQFENELQRLQHLAQEQKVLTEKRRMLEEEIEDCQLLAQAFGKNGIQALLIEEAIPEIEQEANELLAKLTNNRSQIFIESLRDLKSGGLRETLDIKISDEAGIRSYEMFSGGEAFRIDFSLRIAISKLLARRAGASLQTLIIDEGFGSQDDEALALLMNAIHAIQYEFSKIIIISHLPDFKDNFPTHFCVMKTSNGSYVTIEERG